MEQLVLNIKNKSKIPFLREILKRLEFVEIVEPKKLSVKEKKLLADLDESVDFVNKYKKGKGKARSFNQLLNEL